MAPVRSAPPTLRARVSLASVLVALAASGAQAQTDFYNTDHGRPLTIEDAIVVERHAFELQVAPLTFQRVARGVSHWGIAPSLAWGLAPRTHLEFSVPFAAEDDGSRTRAPLEAAGVELELMHQLNAETTTLPAMALGYSMVLPIGPLAPSKAVVQARALLTRTLRWGRVHLNGAYAPGDDLELFDPGAAELNRWQAGLAVDRTFVLRSLLVGAEVFAQKPITDGGETEWHTSIGVRQQVTPRLAMDAGIGRRLSTGPSTWTLTMGAAYAFAPPRMPSFNGGAR